MSKVNNKALMLAYNNVKELGWTHKRLCQEYGLSMHLLRRISEGRAGKLSADEDCMKCLLRIIRSEFYDDLRNHGGSQSHYFNNLFRDILFLLIEE